MKKLITLTCVALSAVFAVMLANADDTQSGDMGGTMGETTPMQPSDTTTMGEPSRPAAPMTEEKQAMTEDRWKTAKTCTDESGKSYRRGKPGFKACVDEMRRKEQMSGMMGSEQPGTDTGMGSGTTSDSGKYSN